ncbi:HXXEE domain-containing protein [Pseudoneobacillus sp. C159]
MIDWLNANTSFATLLWLFPITFMIHDFEEIIFVEAWFKRNFHKVHHRVPARLKQTFQDMSKITAAQYSIPVFFQLVIYIVATYIAVDYDFYGPFVEFNALIFLHVFMHIGQSLVLGTYALGVGSAIFVTLPYSIYLFIRLITENVIQFSDILTSLPYGILTVLVLYLGHKIAPKIVQR